MRDTQTSPPSDLRVTNTALSIHQMLLGGSVNRTAETLQDSSAPSLDKV